MGSAPAAGETRTPIVRQIDPLTGLRFFAAFGVLLCHFQTELFPGAPALAQKLMNAQANMVGLFFVLSGFVMAHSYSARAIAGRLVPKEFYRARFARIYPIYFVALLLVIPFRLKNWPSGLGVHASDLLFTQFTMTQSWAMWTSAYRIGWLGPSWSLSNEWFFYLLFPFFIRPMLRWRLSHFVAFAAILVLIRTVAVLYFDLFLPPIKDADVRGVGLIAEWLKFSPVVRISDFFLGIVLYRITQRYEGVGLSSAKVAALWIFAALFLFAIDSSTLTLTRIAGPASIPFAILIFFLARNESPFTRFFAHPWLVRRGHESYALYLLHEPIGEAGNAIWRAAFGRASLNSATEPWVTALIILASLYAAHLSGRWIERPGREWILGRRRRQTVC